MADQFQDALMQFSQSLKQFRMGQVLNNANEQIQQIRAAQIEEGEKRQALQSIAQDLTFQLSGMGESPDRVAAIAGSAVPKVPTIQTFEQGLSNAFEVDDKEGMEFYQAQINARRKAEQAAARERMATTSGDKLGKEARNALMSYQKQFNSLSKTLDESKNAALAGIKLVESGNPLTPAAVGPFFARASGERGNLTESEKAVFKGAGDVWSRLQRAWQTNTLSELPESDRTALGQLARLYAEAADKATEEKGLQIVEQARGHGLLAEEDPDILATKVTGGRIRTYRPLGAGAPAATPQTGGGLRKYLQGGN